MITLPVSISDLSVRIASLTGCPCIVGKELRLKQQYFWTAASLADIMRRFKNLDKPLSEFPDCEPPSSHPSAS